MRLVLQRVSEASVVVGGKTVGSIGTGLVLLCGIAKSDAESDAEYLSDKVLGLRIFQDEAGKMNRNVVEAGGSLLVVSQFTLYGDCRRGRRPSFDDAVSQMSNSTDAFKQPANWIALSTADWRPCADGSTTTKMRLIRFIRSPPRYCHARRTSPPIRITA